MFNFQRSCTCPLFVCQTGEPGGKTERMGTQEPDRGGGAAGLLPGALSRP